MAHRSTLIVLVLLATSAPAVAQPPAPPAPATDAPSKVSDEYIFEHSHLRVKYEKDGTGQRQLSVRVKVLTEQAVRHWGQLPLVYAGDTEELTLDRAAVIKPDGSVTDNATGAVRDVALPPPGGLPIHFDIRQKQLTVAGLRPGDSLEVAATWRINKPIVPGHFWFEYAFTKADTVEDERLEIDLPADIGAVLKTRPDAPAEMNGGKGRNADGRRVYEWVTKHKKMPDQKPDGYKGDGSPADVRLTSFKSWEEVARWYRGLMTKPLTPPVAAKAKELTKGLTDPSRKIEAIYDYVSKEVRYVSLSIGIGRFAPHPPEDVLRNQYGDCKDKAALLNSMLAAVGIESFPVLLHSDRSLDEAVASPAEIDHVINVVPNGNDLAQWVWMDSTPEVAPIGLLTPSIRGKRVLLLGGGKHPTRMVRTPADPPFPSVDRVEIDGKVNSIGVFTGTVKFSLRGDTELLVRSMIRELPKEAVKEFVKGMAQPLGISGEFSDEVASDPAATQEPFTMSTKLRMVGFLNWAAPVSDVKAPGRLEVPYAKEEDRREKTVLELGSPQKTVIHIVMELPTGYSMQPPIPVSLSNVAATYASKYTVDGSRLVIERELARLARKIEAAQFAEYSAFATAVQADLAQVVKVRASVVGVPEIPNDATSRELYRAAFDAFGAKNFEAAVALWTRNTDVDPKMGEAWTSLGLAYGELKKYDEAIQAFQKVIELNPYDKRTYGDLGRVQKLAGKLEAATKAYAKHVEINPLDVDTMSTLADIYLDLERYQDAAAVLEKATTMGKPDGWKYGDLAQAYLGLGQHQKAAAAIERALELSPTPDMWTYMSWQLANAGVELDRARDLAQRSEKHILGKTQNLDAASVDDEHFELMETLAWSWDALGMVALKKGALDEAERYARAAWMLGREPDTALNLGTIYEKRQRMSDAVNYYMTAYATADNPSAEMKAHVKRLVGEGDALRPMFDSARMLAYSVLKLPDAGPVGKADYVAVIGADRKAVDFRFLGGNEALRSFEPALRQIEYGVEFPSSAAPRLVLKLTVGCIPSGGCVVGTTFPRNVELKPAK
jgi:tetratricopeptide (TPR) repeat protein